MILYIDTAQYSGSDGCFGIMLTISNQNDLTFLDDIKNNNHFSIVSLKVFEILV